MKMKWRIILYLLNLDKDQQLQTLHSILEKKQKKKTGFLN